MKKESHKRKTRSSSTLQSNNTTTTTTTTTKGNNKTDEKASSSSCSSHKEHMLSLSSLNPYITCPICKGYFVDATTVIDCLHTFCKSCLLKHFEENTDCPKCNSIIHQSHPSHYVAFDRTMQDIVYKLVPEMAAEEQRRRDQFHSQKEVEQQRQRRKRRKLRSRRATTKYSDEEDNADSMDDDEDSESKTDDSEKKKHRQENGSTTINMTTNNNNNNNSENAPKECCSSSQDPGTVHHRMDEHVLLQLMPDEKLEPLERPFVRLSGFATINIVKRLIAYLIQHDINRYNDYDLFCNNELMGRDYSMAFIQKTRWRNRPPTEPLLLIYKEHIDF